MASELQFYGNPANDSGKTIIARVYNSAGAQVGSDVATTESGSLAIYIGDMPTAGAGTYGVRFFEGTTMVGQGLIDWDGTAEVTNQTIDVDVDALPTPLTAAEVNAEVDTAISDASLATAAQISGLNDLSSADVTAAVPTTAQIEAALINEGDGQQLIDAIVVAIGNTNLSEVSLVAAIRADLERGGGMLDALPLLSEIEASTVLAKATDIAGLNDVTAGDVVTAMQAVANDFKADTSSLATQASVDANETKLDTVISNQGSLSVPTAAEIYAEFTSGSNEDAFKADVSALALEATVAALNDLSTADITGAVPTAAQIATAVEAAIINEGDGQQVIDAILQVFNSNLDIPSLELTAIAQAVRSELTTELGRIDVATSTRSDFDSSSDQVTTDAASRTASQADVSSLATQSSVDSVLNIAELLKDYHDNITVFFGSDGTTEATQAESYSMVTYADDGSTVLKRVYFVTDVNGTPTASTLAAATGYTRTAP